MKGADKYCEVFKENEQIGRLAFVPGEHARGKTFEIFVLPEGVQAKWNGRNNSPLNKDTVEVFGVVSGDPGWTEEYGWKHEGPWIDDVKTIYEGRKADQERLKRSDQAGKEQREKLKIARTNELLSTY